MPKFIISAALIVLLLLTACSGATPVQEGTGPAVPTVIAPTVSAQVRIPTPTPADSPISGGSCHSCGEAGKAQLY